MKVKEIYVLCHLYKYVNDEGDESEEGKILGLYTSKKKAKKAAKRYYKLPGFNKYPFDCFRIDKYVVDKDSDWVGGFFNPDDILFHIVKKNIDLWNPEGLLPHAPDNEYDIETRQIAKQLKINHTVDEVAEIISRVCSEAFGREYEIRYCHEIAEAIFNDLNEEFS